MNTRWIALRPSRSRPPRASARCRRGRGGEPQPFPLIYRKAGVDPFLRGMLIPFGRSGYVALFEVESASTVTILAVRHQLEDDYH